MPLIKRKLLDIVNRHVIAITCLWLGVPLCPCRVYAVYNLNNVEKQEVAA